MVDMTSKGTNSTPELTKEIAQGVYAEIISHGNADLAFKNQTDSSIEPEHFKIVDKEADRILKELTAYKNGEVIITPAVPATYDEEGNELTPEVPAVYYEYTNDTQLIAQVSSDYLDVETVFNDLM